MEMSAVYVPCSATYVKKMISWKCKDCMHVTTGHTTTQLGIDGKVLHEDVSSGTLLLDKHEIRSHEEFVDPVLDTCGN